MDGLLLPAEVAGAVIVVVALLLAVFVARRRFLSRRSGTFDCSLRRSTHPMGKGWVLGLARYEADRIEWFRVFDLSLRPRQVLQRTDIQVRERRYPSGREAFSVMSGFVIVTCGYDDGVFELAMSEQSYTGFASWLEAAPPGQRYSVA